MMNRKVERRAFLTQSIPYKRKMYQKNHWNLIKTFRFEAVGDGYITLYSASGMCELKVKLSF